MNPMSRPVELWHAQQNPPNAPIAAATYAHGFATDFAALMPAYHPIGTPAAVIAAQSR